MTLAERIEPLLRDLLATQRHRIEMDAPFAYESDVFARGAGVTRLDELYVGHWDIKISGDTAKATLKKRYGGPGHTEWEIIEVDLDLRHDAVAIVDWRAGRVWGASD